VAISVLSLILINCRSGDGVNDYVIYRQIT